MSYTFPSYDLLEKYNMETKFTDREYVKQIQKEFGDALNAYNVKAKIVDTRMTPFSIQFDVMPDQGVSVKTIKNLRADFEYCMASPVEINAQGETQFTVGIAIKGLVRPTIGLRYILESDEFQNNEMEIPIAAGMDVLGRNFVFDLAVTPHLLIAGTTGSGKSVFLNDIILSILYSRTPDEVKLIMVDPKLVELSAYRDIPHLATNVIYDSEKAIAAMEWLDQEMMDRYNKFAEVGVKKIDDYNSIVDEDKKLPRLVIIIDEYMEMMYKAPKRLEELIAHLARLARAAGIHLILATQRPSSDVITSSIKANIPCRASFTVVDWRESKTILDRTGAERLLGSGDMLYSSTDSNIPIHAQSAYVSYEEVDRVVAAVR